MNHAQITVNGARGVQNVSAGAGRVERAGNLLSHVGGFARAGDADSTGATVNQIDGFQERIAQALRHQMQRVAFRSDDFPSVCQPSGIGLQTLRRG